MSDATPRTTRPSGATRPSGPRKPLRWGTERERVVAALALLVIGALQVQASHVDDLTPLAIGLVATVLGWWIAPADGWRRVLAAGPGTLAVAITVAGPQSLWLLALPFLCWQLVRHRPWRSALAALVVVAVGVVVAQLFDEYDDMLAALAITAGALAIADRAAVLLARMPAGAGLRAFARGMGRERRTPSNRQ